MAKKKQSKPKAAKKPALKSAKKTDKKPRTLPRSPRSQALPGMEQVTNRVLNNLAEEIKDSRATKNTAVGSEKGAKASALREMQIKGITVYKHDGIEFARVPGAENLRIRTVKQDGDAAVEGGKTRTVVAEAATDGGDDEDVDDEVPF